MKRSDIQSELIRSFGQMDPSQGGAVIVWHDPEGEFEETLDELELPGIEVIREQENHAFELKCAMNEDLAGRSILLYRKRSRVLEGDWLADIEMRAERFSADYASVQLREINAEDTPEMRTLLAEHKALLSKKTHRQAPLRAAHLLHRSQAGRSRTDRRHRRDRLPRTRQHPAHLAAGHGGRGVRTPD